MSTTRVPLTALWRRYAETQPDAPAVSIDDDPSMTWVELHRRSNQLARVLTSSGVQRGDFVSIGLPTSTDFATTVMATLKVGAIPQPLAPRLPATELEQILQLVRPAVALGLDPSPHARLTMAEVPAHLQEDDSDLPDVVSPSQKAPASGGSTGRPKIIVSGEDATVACIDGRPVPPALPIDEAAIYPGPLHHNTALSGLLGALTHGGHAVFESRFDAEMTLRLIERHRISFSVMVPTHLSRIRRLDPCLRDCFGLDSLRLVMHNAAPCPPDLKRDLIDWLGPDRIAESYAATELGVAVFTFCTGREWLQRPGTVGQVRSGEIEIRTARGEPAQSGEVGAIWLRRPEGTPSTYHYIGSESAELPDRWDTVGDLGWMDADGYLFLADRRTDLIITGGANVYPAEVENALLAHPHVLDCAVIGLPDDDMGQLVHAIVQPAVPELSEVEIRAHLVDRLSRSKSPRTYEFVDHPLRSDAGKMRRSQLVAERAAENPSQSNVSSTKGNIS